MHCSQATNLSWTPAANELLQTEEVHTAPHYRLGPPAAIAPTQRLTSSSGLCRGPSATFKGQKTRRLGMSCKTPLPQEISPERPQRRKDEGRRAAPERQRAGGLRHGAAGGEDKGRTSERQRDGAAPRTRDAAAPSPGHGLTAVLCTSNRARLTGARRSPALHSRPTRPLAAVRGRRARGVLT